ncbi:SbcD-like subunit of palindrome specific endonuclease [Pseudomonas phage Psa21]|uniref:Nuclease SbcCD, subunit D n=1 Tax=Pseudomonas phage Psa21 TaxID=2530023 RepID=A0A481W4F2_9CAUD|nr:SbcD-like subunit of palindrome specific endonuclease [Pseudomonas phage Psa21]QBJ02596.1 nuclease SbcCD, subunit D [Pseudomonas phage Psa21]
MKTDLTKTPGFFRYLSLGDVHLGHRSTPTAMIIRNLELTITDELLKEVDMLIITGDLFDRQLNNGDEVVHQINRWITLLMLRCAAFKVMIRIVEGTPSHDREQSRFFTEQRVNADIDVDLHYTKNLSIEYIERLDSYFLYVPDKHNPSTDVTLAEVKLRMAELGIEKVDFAIMHGAFSYQLPAIVPEPTHNEEEYLKLVKHQILIGHVHLMTIRERILAAGSFDRICHNDEGAKGMFKVTVKDDGTWENVFIENRGAKKYVTLDCHGMDTKQLNFAIREFIKGLDKGSAVRLRCNPNDVANGDIETYRREFPLLDWTVTVDKVESKKNTVAETFQAFDMAQFKAITRDSIKELLIPALAKFAPDEAAIMRCLQRLDGLA